jgi:hypothetical protein
VQGLTGAAIQVAKETVGASTREVTIRGAPASVAAARAALEQIIEQATGRGAAKAEPRVEFRIPCAADRIGWVIGLSGATVKAIRTLSGAHLDMLEEVTETGGRRGVVVVSGTGEQVMEAKLALQGLLGANSAASKAYAAQLLEAAEKRKAWDQAQRRAAAGPSGAAAEGAAGGEDEAAGTGEAAAAPPAQAASGWRQVETTHPDGSVLSYWVHSSGVCRW